jgi:hypothetical protein
MLRGKFIPISPYIIKTEIYHFKLLEKQEQTKPQPNRCREITQMRTKTSEIETKNKQTKKLY